MGSLEATLGPRRFFLPIRVGGGGSHFGFCFWMEVSWGWRQGQRDTGTLRLCHRRLFLCCRRDRRPCLVACLIASFPAVRNGCGRGDGARYHVCGELLRDGDDA